jgi:hypothetical protein
MTLVRSLDERLFFLGCFSRYLVEINTKHMILWGLLTPTAAIGN